MREGIVPGHFIGETKSSKELGYVGNDYTIYYWVACINCGKARWRTKKNKSKRCMRCKSIGRKMPTGSNSKLWRGGRTKHNGYIEIWVDPKDFYYSMADAEGYVPEHRLVMAKSLGRCLNYKDVVHHKNGDKLDNRIENLELTTNGKHITDHHKGYQDGLNKGYCDGQDKRINELERRVTLLEAENELLKSQIGVRLFIEN
jgi:hypothetical protein